MADKVINRALCPLTFKQSNVQVRLRRSIQFGDAFLLFIRKKQRQTIFVSSLFDGAFEDFLEIDSYIRYVNTTRRKTHIKSNSLRPKASQRIRIGGISTVIFLILIGICRNKFCLAALLAKAVIFIWTQFQSQCDIFLRHSANNVCAIAFHSTSNVPNIQLL